MSRAALGGLVAVVLAALAAAGLRLGEEFELRPATPRLKFGGTTDLGPLRARMPEDDDRATAQAGGPTPSRRSAPEAPDPPRTIDGMR